MNGRVRHAMGERIWATSVVMSETPTTLVFAAGLADLPCPAPVEEVQPLTAVERGHTSPRSVTALAGRKTQEEEVSLSRTPPLPTTYLATSDTQLNVKYPGVKIGGFAPIL